MRTEQLTPQMMLMADMQVVHLQFDVVAIDDIGFNRQPGSDLRGALYEVMGDNFCGARPAERTEAHKQTCPVCRLLAAEELTSGRGKDVPRPLTLEPPLMSSPIRRGREFTFGISLIGWAEQALLYIIRAAELMGQTGVGHGRGRFQLRSVREVSPLTGESDDLLIGRTVHRPQLMVTAAAIEEITQMGQAERIVLELLTPMQLKSEGRPVDKPNPIVLMQRLVERCQGLVEHSVLGMGAQRGQREAWHGLHQDVGRIAATATVESQDLRWVKARSGSRRKQGFSSISGLMGSMVWSGDLRPLLPWLLWGQSLHVGKNAVKGNGWYRIWR